MLADRGGAAGALLVAVLEHLRREEGRRGGGEERHGWEGMAGRLEDIEGTNGRGTAGESEITRKRRLGIY